MRRAHEPFEASSDFYVQVGKRIRMARFRARLTPSQLARMVGTDEAEIASWETGSSVIYFDEMAVVCRALGITPHDVLGWRQG